MAFTPYGFQNPYYPPPMQDNLMQMRQQYSRDGYSRGEWAASRGSYGRENSYRRSHYVRGHYSNDDGRGQLREKLEGMAQGADEKTRDVLMRAMEMLEE